MSDTQMVFERYERKYLLDPSAKAAVLAAMNGRMQLDRYGKTTIRNLYFDTADYDLIRTSLSGPEYKEKLRIRSYRQVDSGDEVFVELKKKYKGIVYKRRVRIPEFQAMDWLCAGGGRPETEVPVDLEALLDPQAAKAQEQPNFRIISEEIDRFFRRYERSEMAPKVFLGYDREAYAPIDPDPYMAGFRVTFDTNILARGDDLKLSSGVYGDRIIPEDLTVMELKVRKDGAIPLWMARCLSENRIFRQSFSKYGRYYKDTIFEKTHTVITPEREDVFGCSLKGELIYV